jgi:hypothetical protein
VSGLLRSYGCEVVSGPRASGRTTRLLRWVAASENHHLITPHVTATIHIADKELGRDVSARIHPTGNMGRYLYDDCRYAIDEADAFLMRSLGMPSLPSMIVVEHWYGEEEDDDE